MISRITKRQKFFIGTGLLFVSVISSVVAGTVTINTTNRVEFGQALYQAGACDSFVNIVPDSDGTDMHRIFVDGLDLSACPNVYIRIRAYGSGSSPLNLYQDSGIAVNRILLEVTDPTEPFDGLGFRNALGLRPTYSSCLDENASEEERAQVICKSDGFLSLEYIGGRYVLAFTFPLADPEVVKNFTIETATEAPEEVVTCSAVLTVSKISDGDDLKGITLDGLDIRKCPDTYIRIRFFNGASRLQLYQDTTTTEATVSDRILLYVKLSPQDRFNDVIFRNSLGQVPPMTSCPEDGFQSSCKTDGFLSLDYFAGRYTFTFAQPKALYAAALRYELETSSELPSDEVM